MYDEVQEQNESNTRECTQDQFWENYNFLKKQKESKIFHYKWQK